MGNNIKTFLGKKPFKVVDSYSKLNKDEVTTIKSVNNYLIENNPKFDVPKLGASISGCKLTNTAPVIYTAKDAAYLPLKIAFHLPLHNSYEKRVRPGTYFSNGLFYVEGIGSRPNAKYLIKHYLDLLSSPYTGTVHNILSGAGNNVGRYVLCLDNANNTYIQALLDIAVRGRGDVIDYSWISAFQDLLEQNADAAEKERNKLTVPETDVEDDIDDAPYHFGDNRSIHAQEQLSALQKALRAKSRQDSFFAGTAKRYDRTNNLIYAGTAGDPAAATPTPYIPTEPIKESRGILRLDNPSL